MSRLYEYFEERYFRLHIKFQVLCERVENLWNWLPVVWADRHWDYAFLITLVQHKLRLMREHIQKHGCHLNKERDCKNIRIAELLLERIKKENYAEKEWKEHFAKFPRPLLGEEGERDPATGLFVWPAPSEADVKAAQLIFKLEREREDRDWEFLGRHLRKHLRQWWD